MIKSRELTIPTSCLNQAKLDEPVFVLRANDELAPKVVEAWAQAYEITKRSRQAFGPVQQAKAHEALDAARQMREWKAKHP